jgi:hypothetical protein
MMTHKVVIANSKGANCGKSTSIRYVFEILSKRYPSGVTILKPDDGIYNPLEDVAAIIKIPQPNGEIVSVGIESMGDPGYARPQESVDKFVAAGCEIILVTTRLRKPTIGCVTDLRDNHNWQVIWFDNSTMWVDDWCNKTDASGTRLAKQDEQVQNKLSWDYAHYVASLIERLVLTEGVI